MAEDRVGFGLLGAGLIAPFHAKSILAAEGCELVAVADLDAERAGKVAEEYGCGARDSLESLLTDDAIDVICILTPNHLHAEAAVAAAKAGKSVLCEKPPSMSLAETDAMIAAAEAAGTHLGIVLQCRVRKAIGAMKQAIDSGRFGRMLQADTTMKWFRSVEYYLSDGWRSSRRSGAGVTVQHAFHYIDLLQHLMGPAVRVQARQVSTVPTETPTSRPWDSDRLAVRVTKTRDSPLTCSRLWPLRENAWKRLMELVSEA